MKTIVAILTALVTFAASVVNLQAQGTDFTYQGFLTDTGAPANGVYDLQLTVFNAVTAGGAIGVTTTINDLSVTNGLFTVTVSPGAGVFDGSARWLNIAVRPGVSAGAYTNVVPRQPILATPYAITAGTITGLLAPANVPSGFITGTMLSNFTIGGTQIASNSIGSAQLADSIGLGVSNVNGRLDVFATSVGTPSISLVGSANQISTYGDDGLEQIRLWGPTYGEILLNNSLSNNAQAVRLTANGALGGSLYLNNTNSSVRAQLQGLNSGGSLSLYQADGALGVFIDGDSAGSGFMSLRNTNGSTRISLYGQGTGGAGEISVNDTNGTQTLQMLGQSGANLGAKITLRQDSGTTSVVIDGEYGSSEGGAVQLYNGAGDLGLHLDGDQNNAGAAFFYKAAGGTSVSIQESGNAGLIYVYRTNGSIGIQLDGNDANGDARVVTQVLQITGGSDLSEQFDISGNRTPEPGDVVVIDADQPGHLLVSTKRYDRTVAGIISGAGGVKTGMLMGQVGTKADGKQSVALTGRVFVKADASKGAIRPGDLLTTSDLPGHAMKVSDHGLAQGAILGKAMTALNEGTGMVLVLVTLQ